MCVRVVLNWFSPVQSDGVKVSPVASRASGALWVFSTGLCVGVAALVVAAIIYQVLVDRGHKELRKTHRGGDEEDNGLVVIHHFGGN